MFPNIGDIGQNFMHRNDGYQQKEQSFLFDNWWQQLIRASSLGCKLQSLNPTKAVNNLNESSPCTDSMTKAMIDSRFMPVSSVIPPPPAYFNPTSNCHRQRILQRPSDWFNLDRSRSDSSHSRSDERVSGDAIPKSKIALCHAVAENGVESNLDRAMCVKSSTVRPSLDSRRPSKRSSNDIGGNNSPINSLPKPTKEQLARLARIPNVIGPFRCQLCDVLFDDGFQLAGHRCPCIRHTDYRCPECDKVFNCPANLASHRRWHRPRSKTDCQYSQHQCNHFHRRRQHHQLNPYALAFNLNRQMQNRKPAASQYEDDQQSSSDCCFDQMSNQAAPFSPSPRDARPAAKCRKSIMDEDDELAVDPKRPRCVNRHEEIVDNNLVSLPRPSNLLFGIDAILAKN